MGHEGSYGTLEADKVESLRLILQRQLAKHVGYKEALEIGESLISFYEVLADDGINPSEINQVDQNEPRT